MGIRACSRTKHNFRLEELEESKEKARAGSNMTEVMFDCGCGRADFMNLVVATADPKGSTLIQLLLAARARPYLELP